MDKNGLDPPGAADPKTDPRGMMSKTPAIATRATKRSKTQAEPDFEMPLTVTRTQLLEKGSDHQFRQLIYDLGRLGEIVNGARRHLADELGVTPAQYSIIMVIAEYEGESGVNVAEVAAHHHVSGAFVTAQVNQLVEAGLIEKSPHPTDGRSVLLRLTPKSKSEIRRVAPHICEFNDMFFSAMSRKSFKEFAGAVADLIRTGEKALLDATTRAKLSATARRAMLRRHRAR